jgi:hypothetical protein
VEELIRFVVNYEMGIYLILGVVFVINLQKMIRALINKRKATFGLEKEIAQKNLRSSITLLSLVALFGISNFILVSVASIQYPGMEQLPTPTVDMLATKEPVMEDLMPVEEEDEGASATQTAIAVTGCIPDVLEWKNPTNDAEVSGSVELIGTVNVPNMGFYKYEYRYQPDSIWTPISAGNKPVIDEPLGGVWNTEEITPGNYYLRLVISDNANNLLQPCEIQVKVLAP